MPELRVRESLVAPSARSRIAIVASVLVGVVLALIVVAIGVAAVVMPGCERCHLSGKFETATASAPHASLECVSCHGGNTVAARTTFAVAEVFGMWLKLTAVDPSVAVVPSARCASCHEDVTKRISDSEGLRIKHDTCAVTRECTDCHSPTAHGTATTWPRTSTMEMCFDCHGEGGATDECDSCHAERLPEDRIQSSTFAVTHGPNHLKTHGLGKMSSCTACHESSKCEKCHGTGLPHSIGFVNAHGPAAKSTKARCTGCHEKKFCSDCHVYQMPHTRAFMRGHAKTVEDKGEASCRRCHADPDCDECHRQHIHPVTLEQLNILGIPSVVTTP